MRNLILVPGDQLDHSSAAFNDFDPDCDVVWMAEVEEDVARLVPYWEFLDRHYDQLKNNQRMKFPIKNLEKMRKQPDEVPAIRNRATELRKAWS